MWDLAILTTGRFTEDVLLDFDIFLLTAADNNLENSMGSVLILHERAAIIFSL